MPHTDRERHPSEPPAVASLKASIRAEHLEGRASLSVSQRDAQDLAAFAVAQAALADGPAAVACYLSRAPEPDTLRLVEWLFTSGRRVLVPVLGSFADGSPRREPDWAWFDGRTHPGLWGIPDPDGPPLGLDALASVDLVLCSALAVSRDGHRLGVGGGWFDRALRARRPGTPVWALIRSGELVDRLPWAPDDERVDAALTPEGLIPVG